MSHMYPVGRAQSIVLDALGRNDIETYQDAEAFFQRIGITVIPVRQGRSTVPSIKRCASVGGGFNDWGEGETYEIGYEKIDFSKIEQWMVKE